MSLCVLAPPTTPQHVTSPAQAASPAPASPAQASPAPGHTDGVVVSDRVVTAAAAAEAVVTKVESPKKKKSKKPGKAGDSDK